MFANRLMFYLSAAIKFKLEKASKFIFQNHGKIKKPEEWDQIKKTHPHIATKVMDLIVFDNEPPSQG